MLELQTAILLLNINLYVKVIITLFQNILDMEILFFSI